ncbi:DUF3300 domain-containing protein [Puniceicoccales bacterium CK1056]|uniref:DUF3300 domain-containing protein n=1 Tax=Oceanipulchritudo coccoides TaxID=2706888 RepID=A0A6B2M5L9_9BACT|nr:DUF3300 domain-containing protein [Oceanipulchritudo coccoides]NDV62970.1 DUF3300 domain-containing protein [Oceanipulchritudo coccoides]
MKFYKYPLIVSLLITSLCPILWAQEEEESYFTQPELDQMLAPVALYPDVLLSQVLMAATYPLEVVEASRWSQANEGLEGDEAVRAVEDESWDDSVKSLVGFPELIQLMDRNLSWTRRLGDAFLIQEEQVMETVQNLRSKALETGNLASLEHVRVEETPEQIIIEPARVEVVYVPYYSTRIVYGDWWWPNYPPVYWYGRPAYHSSIGFSWSRGFRVSSSFYFSSCDWSRRSIVIYHDHRGRDRYDFRRVHNRRDHLRDAPRWRHEPVHRKGVYYRSRDLNDRYDRRRYVDSSRKRAHDERIGDLRDRTRRVDITDRVPSREERLKRPVDRPNPSRDERVRTNPRQDQERVGDYRDRRKQVDTSGRVTNRQDRFKRPVERPKPPEVAKKPPRRTPPAAVEKTPPKVTLPPPDTSRSVSRSTVTTPVYRRTDDAPRRVPQNRDRGRRAPITDRDP